MANSFRYFLLITLCIYISCTHTKYKEPTVKIETNFGDIIVELYPEKAPKTVAAFLSYVDSGYYERQLLLSCTKRGRPAIKCI